MVLKDYAISVKRNPLRIDYYIWGNHVCFREYQTVDTDWGRSDAELFKQPIAVITDSSLYIILIYINIYINNPVVISIPRFLVRFSTSLWTEVILDISSSIAVQSLTVVLM